MKTLFYLATGIIFITSMIYAKCFSQEIPDGPYLGQSPPGVVPEIFAPDIISLPNRDESHPTFTSDGKEFYFRSQTSLFRVRQENGHWAGPEPYKFFNYSTIEPFFSHDSRKLYFQRQGDIWLSEKNASEWGNPNKLDAPVSTNATEWYPTVSNNGTLYFTSNRSGGKGNMDIYKSKLLNGQYMTVENLGDSINTGYGEYDPIIAPDESFIIFSSDRPGEYGTWDFYISFQRKDSSWTRAMDMGAIINEGDGGGWSPKLSPDGKYFFFARTSKNGQSDIYWFDTEIIDRLKYEKLNYYFGQAPPGKVPKIFAPGIVSLDNRYEDHGVFSPDGKEFLITVYNQDYSSSHILYTKLENDDWTEQTIPAFANTGNNAEPVFYPDGQKIYFGSTRPPGSPPWNSDIWMTIRIDSGDGWSEPIHTGDILNSNTGDGVSSIADNGNLYISTSRSGGKGGVDFYVAKRIDEGYPMIENLGDSINTKSHEFCPCVSPDESYIIFEAAYPGGYGGTDLYISFHKQDDSWTAPINWGASINSSANDECPVISGDGKYLFFGSRRSGLADIYWVDIDVVEQLKPSWLITSITNKGKKKVIKSFNLYQNYPNPFNPVTTIKYNLLKPTFVNLKIYNLVGQEIETLLSSYQTAGEYQVKWIAEDFSSGIYFYRLQADEFTETKKLILQK